MKLDDYREAYRKIEISEEMDERIRCGIMDRKRKVNKRSVMKAACVAAAIALVIGALQIPAVSAAAEQLIARFTGQILIYKEDGTEVIKVELAGKEDNKYLKLNENARKEDCKIDSLKQAEKELGVSLLKSEEAAEEKNCISYNPYVSKKGALNGVMLINYAYMFGDLQDVETTTYEEWDYVNSVSYRSGKEYHSPIMMQILIRSDQKEGVDYENHELEYAGISEERSENEGMRDITLYDIKNLGVKAIVTTVDTDGANAWKNQAGEEITSCTDALFVYKGVEYRYFGAVSQKVMEEFLEGLAE